MRQTRGGTHILVSRDSNKKKSAGRKPDKHTTGSTHILAKKREVSRQQTGQTKGTHTLESRDRARRGQQAAKATNERQHSHRTTYKEMPLHIYQLFSPSLPPHL